MGAFDVKRNMPAASVPTLQTWVMEANATFDMTVKRRYWWVEGAFAFSGRLGWVIYAARLGPAGRLEVDPKADSLWIAREHGKGYQLVDHGGDPIVRSGLKDITLDILGNAVAWGEVKEWEKPTPIPQDTGQDEFGSW